MVAHCYESLASKREGHQHEVDGEAVIVRDFCAGPQKSRSPIVGNLEEGAASGIIGRRQQLQQQQHHSTDNTSTIIKPPKVSCPKEEKMPPFEARNSCDGGARLETATGSGELERICVLTSSATKYGACQLLADSATQKSVDCHHHHRHHQSQLSPAAGAAKGDDDKGGGQRAFIERAAERIPGLGVIMALCASLFLGTAGMLVKMTHSIHGIQVSVFRAFIQLAIYLAIIGFRRIPLVPRRGEWLAVCARALLGATSITFSYYALKLIPLGDATTIRFSLPIWTLIVSYLLLGESCGPMKVGAVIVSIAGVVLIAKPDDCLYVMHLCLRSLNLEGQQEFAKHLAERDAAHARELQSFIMANQEDEAAAMSGGGGGANFSSAMAEATTTIAPLGQLVAQAVATNGSGSGSGSSGGGRPAMVVVERQFEGCMMALASSICLSLSLIALRLCKQTPAEVTIVWLSLGSVAIGTSTLLLLGEWRLPNNLLDYAFVLLNGLCGAIGQWFITNALKIEQSGIIALTRTVDIEVAFFYSALLLHETIRLTSIVGSALVSFGVVTVVASKWLFPSKSEPQQDEAAATVASIAADSQEKGQQQTIIGAAHWRPGSPSDCCKHGGAATETPPSRRA